MAVTRCKRVEENHEGTRGHGKKANSHTGSTSVFTEKCDMSEINAREDWESCSRTNWRQKMKELLLSAGGNSGVQCLSFLMLLQVHIVFLIL